MEDSAKASSQKERLEKVGGSRLGSEVDVELGRSVVIEGGAVIDPSSSAPARERSALSSSTPSEDASRSKERSAPVEIVEESASLQATSLEGSFSSSADSGSAPAVKGRLELEKADLRVAFARLLASGTTLPAAIDTLGIEKQLAASFLASDGFQELLRANLPKVEDVRDVLLAHASQAALKIVHLMNSAKSEEECGRSARDLLDRVGVVAKKHVSVASYHFHEAKSTLVEETLKEIRGSVLSSNGGS